MQVQDHINTLFSKKAVKRYQAQLKELKALKAELKISEVAQAFTLYERTEDPLVALCCMGYCIEKSLGKTPFDTQYLCALALIEGKLCEMKTGEGKTLAVGLAAAALAKKGPVHVITSNEYLALRDAQLLASALNCLGLSVGFNSAQMSASEKQIAYSCDVMYCTANELGFDYLRDHTARDPLHRVQSGLSSVIVDEADFLMIDEARTPLILTTPNQDLSELITCIWNEVNAMNELNLEIDKKAKQVHINPVHYEDLERSLIRLGLLAEANDLYRAQFSHLLSIVQACMNAKFCYAQDVDYVVYDDEIKIIDPGTGRIMQGRRWSHFLHSAIEAKEGVQIQRDSQVQASITLQAYLRLYGHLCGLTGTCMTEAHEFAETYGLTCVQIPTQKPVIRVDLPDRVFLSKNDKLAKAVSDIQGHISQGRPVLVACESVEECYKLSTLLRRARIGHETLTGNNPEKEAQVIAKAGEPSQVTVTTQIAGRGTDIVLGGDPNEPEFEQKRQQVLKAGGLHVLATCANTSRRVDNQLRGRAGRQGDPGSSQRFISLEDSLVQAFTSNKLLDRARQLGAGEGVEFESKFIQKMIHQMQLNSELMGFEARKELAKYDEALSSQRKIVYDLRAALIEDTIERDFFVDLVAKAIVRLILDSQHFNEFDPDWERIEQDIGFLTGIHFPLMAWLDDLEPKQFEDQLAREVQDLVSFSFQAFKQKMLYTLDALWSDYLTHLEELKEGIYLLAYAQLNPVYAYQEEAFKAFEGFKTQLGLMLIEDWAKLSVSTQISTTLEDSTGSNDTGKRRNRTRSLDQKAATY